MKKGKIDIDTLLGKVFKKVSDEEIEAARERSWKRLQAKMAERDDLDVRSIYGDGWSVGPLQQLEYQVLSAIATVGGQREPGDIFRTAQDWAPGLDVVHIYGALTRLERRGFVTAHPGRNEGLRLYEVSGEGARAIKRAKLEGKELVSARVVPLEDSLGQGSEA